MPGERGGGSKVQGVRMFAMKCCRYGAVIWASKGGKQGHEGGAWITTKGLIEGLERTRVNGLEG